MTEALELALRADPDYQKARSGLITGAIITSLGVRLSWPF